MELVFRQFFSFIVEDEETKGTFVVARVARCVSSSPLQAPTSRYYFYSPVPSFWCRPYHLMSPGRTFLDKNRTAAHGPILLPNEAKEKKEEVMRTVMYGLEGALSVRTRYVEGLL